MSVVACALLIASSSTPLPTIAVVETIGSDVAFDARATFDFVPSLAITNADEDTRKALLGCAGEIACIRRAVPVEFLRALVVIIEKRATDLSVAIELIDTTTPGLLVRDFAEIASTDDPRGAITAELRSALARAGHPTFGALRVDARPDDAAIAVDGRSSLPRVLLAPGLHALRVAAPDHVARDLEVDVVAGAERSLAVALEPASRDGATWLWIGAAAATVALAAGVVAAVVHSNGDDGPVVLCQRTAEGSPCGAR